ncbi:hypothetical protein ACWDUG_29485, partial [Streptomyces cellulosae]
ERAGLLRRSPDPHDRRGLQVTLTEEGCFWFTASTPVSPAVPPVAPPASGEAPGASGERPATGFVPPA